MSILYIVATPIGNLDDITIRAVKTLSAVDKVLAEDTRTARRLFQHCGISRPLLAYHDFNKERVSKGIIDELLSGTTFALVSEAGTPGIADPAFYLVREAHRAGIRVEPVPGPCAAIAAIVASGLPTDSFIFDGFLPVKKNKRRRLLESLRDECRTVIFFESPHRIRATLADLAITHAGKLVVIARELTKIHEEFIMGTPGEITRRFEQTPPRGEIVILLNAGVSPDWFKKSSAG